MPKVSVIVPIWNVEKYLPKCLDSLINQTLKDIEIICINDGSPDNCLNILKEYQAKDDRIIIIDQTNQGVSIARNKGLEIAKGEYIGFIDPDDWVDLDFYETLYDKAIETNADIVKGNLKVIVNDKVTRATTLYNDTIRNNKMLFYYYSCTAIFKKEKIKKNNVDFPIGLPLGEDLVFCVKMAFYANKIIVLDNVFYNYFQRHNSGSSIKRDKKRVDSYIYTH